MKYLSLTILYPTLLCIFGPGSPSFAAERETPMLTITGHLIGEIASLNENTSPEKIISSYYGLLEDQPQANLNELRHRMERRTKDYQVAYRAADTAEINETLNDLGWYWASIRTIHADEFTNEVISQLSAAYASLFSFLAADP